MAVSLSVLLLVKSSQHGRACVSVVLRVVVHFYRHVEISIQ
jgi:hypothetical protein